MRKEHWLGVFENRLLRNMFYSQEGGRKTGWAEFQNKELHGLFS